MARAAGASAGARRAVAGFALEIRDTFRERWVALSERHLDAYGVSPTLRAELQARRVAVLSGDDAGQQPDGLTPMDRAVVAGQVTLPDDELAAALGVSRQRVAARRCELIERDPVLSDLLERERGDLLRLASGRRGAQPEDRERLLSRRSAFNAKRR